MKRRRTKIIATLGPASNKEIMIKKLILAGVDVFRLNFSHGDLNDHLQSVKSIRKIAQELHTATAILADLPGPKLRVSRFGDAPPVVLKKGHKVILTTRRVRPSSEEIPVSYRELPSKVSKGDHILLDDGLLELRVDQSEARNIHCTIITGGLLKEKKGINLPGLRLPIPALTKDDREILKAIAEWDLDFVALSFVQREEDLLDLRRYLRKLGISLPIIAKIEKPQALERIEGIMRHADGLMIARGDLGVEMESSEVPVVQKRLIRRAAHTRLPVITATQMLDSMIYNPRPTRAESTDVANAIWDGTDAVMLSGETASGKYPVESVRMMAKIIEEAEMNPDFQWKPSLEATDLESDAEAMLRAANQISNAKKHAAIVIYTRTGATALSLSRYRPTVPIVALTPEKGTQRQMNLVWGVRAFVSPQGENMEDMISEGDRILMENAGLRKNDRVILTAGTNMVTGATNLMKVHRVGQTLVGVHQKK